MKTDNELIAEFMGLRVYKISSGNCYGVLANGKPAKHPTKRHESHLRYSSSWDWLMPVVEKIESIGYATKIRYEAFTQGEEMGYHDIEIFTLNENNGYLRVACCTERIPKIQAVYKAVVEFIKWYNTQKTN